MLSDSVLLMNLLCWQMICQPHFVYLFHLINDIVTDGNVTKVRCYWPIFIYFILFYFYFVCFIYCDMNGQVLLSCEAVKMNT